MDPETQLGTVLDGVDQTFRMQILVAFGGVEASKVHVIIYIDIYIYIFCSCDYRIPRDQ